MAKQAVGIGTSANDGTGDTLRAGADKINDNFDEIYSALGNGTTLTDIIDTNGVLDVSQGANKIVFYYAALSDSTQCINVSRSDCSCSCDWRRCTLLTAELGYG